MQKTTSPVALQLYLMALGRLVFIDPVDSFAIDTAVVWALREHDLRLLPARIIVRVIRHVYSNSRFSVVDLDPEVVMEVREKHQLNTVVICAKLFRGGEILTVMNERVPGRGQ